MISEKDKQAILNGAFGVTRDGRKAKLVGFKIDGSPVFDIENHSAVANTLAELIVLTDDFTFYTDKEHRLDIIGLWQDKPEPFNLNRALKGECVNYSGEPCYIYYSNRKTETHEYIVEAKSGAFVVGRVPLDALEKCEMWKEPQVQLSTESVQLPKPLTELPSEDTTLYSIGLAEDGISRFGKFEVSIHNYCIDSTQITKTLDETYLKNGRLYATREEVIQVIEAITGKPYVD